MTVASRRLLSLDALRGCTVAAMLLVNDAGDWDHVFAPLEHAQWHGCTPTDLIFPFFLFVMGVSAGLGIVPRAEQGADTRALFQSALMRALRIVALGLAVNFLAAWLLPGAHWRIPGVLQRIGICFAATAVFAIWFKVRTWWIAIACLLAGYWVLLLTGGTLKPWNNIVSRADSFIFGSTVYSIDTASGRGHDPEGLLSTLPSLATSLFGLCASVWLRQGQRRSLLIAGIVAVLLAALWSAWLPFNKNLWTPSFALWCAGWSMLALLSFHIAIDQWHWPPLGRRFGVNAITAYAGSELMQILLPALGWQQPIYDRLFSGWITPIAGPYMASLTYAIAFVALWWLIVLAMDRRRLYVNL